MTGRLAAVLIGLSCLIAAPRARADVTGSSLTVEALGGWQHLQATRESLAGAVAGDVGTTIFGGDLLAKMGLFGIGLSLDKAVSGDVKPWDGSIMAGVLIDVLPSLRLEALGEIGRRSIEFKDMFGSDGATFVGLRPGVSVRLLPAPIRIGVTGLVRWPTSDSDFGSPDYGIIGRVGFELP
jgi:hypothetical protein